MTPIAVAVFSGNSGGGLRCYELLRRIVRPEKGEAYELALPIGEPVILIGQAEIDACPSGASLKVRQLSAARRAELKKAVRR